MTALGSVCVKFVSCGVLTVALPSRGKIGSPLPLQMPFLIMPERLLRERQARQESQRQGKVVSFGWTYAGVPVPLPRPRM